MRSLITIMMCLSSMTALACKGTLLDHDFKKLASSENVNLCETYSEKVVLVVNTASKCGLTPQYKKLQALYEKYSNKNFEIVGFPANNFLFQEPGTDKEISEFCEKNYGVTFPMMSKISVKGKSMHPVYEFLTQESKNGVISSSVSWNFQKYLINTDGQLARVVSPRTQPDDPKVISWIEN